MIPSYPLVVINLGMTTQDTFAYEAGVLFGLDRSILLVLPDLIHATEIKIRRRYICVTLEIKLQYNFILS